VQDYTLSVVLLPVSVLVHTFIFVSIPNPPQKQEKKPNCLFYTVVQKKKPVVSIMFRTKNLGKLGKKKIISDGPNSFLR